jgi:uncharacterized protein (TIGR03437 family)
MGPLTPSGSRLVGLNLLLLPLLSVTYAQTGPLFCVASATAPIVRSEGVSERTGDILIECSGGTPGRTTEGNLTVILPVPVSNRLNADNTLDAMLLIDTGTGFQPAAAGIPHGSQGVAFNGVRFTVPPSGRVSLRVSNLRINVSQFGATQRPIQAQLAFNGLNTLSIQNNLPTVAVTDRGLLASFATRGIPCVGSPLPAVIDIPNLLAEKTFFTPTRVTEGFASAFQPREPAATNGTRIISRFSGFPPGARLFVPDIVSGSSAELLLARVLNTDANGAGGVPVSPGSFNVSSTSVSEVALANGAGIAVYEVISANPSVRESFEFATFLGYTPPNNEGTVVGTQQILLGPISNVGVADSNSPVPRFVPGAVPSDCTELNDCDAPYFPKLFVSSPPLQFTGITGGTAWNPRYFIIRNENSAGSDMAWALTVNYKSGSGWLLVEPAFGIDNATVRVDVLMTRLTPGTYEAAITIDAGPFAGTRTLPVVAVVNALPTIPQPSAPAPPPAPTAVISSFGNAASPWPGALTPGSLATIKGSKLAGSQVRVTFDNLPATLLYTSDSQINLLVPAELGNKTSAQMVITVDGASSAPQTVQLAPIAPAIFSTGVLNQNNTANTSTTGARVGSVVQLFVTGLLPAAGQAVVTAKIHDREDLIPQYAGPAPALQGVQQVNVTIPEDLPAMTTEVLVCATSAAGQKVCSLPVKLTLTE